MTMKFSKKNGEDNETLQHTTHVDKLDVAIDYTYPQRKKYPPILRAHSH